MYTKKEMKNLDDTIKINAAADEHHHDGECPVQKSLEILGKKWNILIVKTLVEGSKRFCEIQANLDHIAPTILSGRLKELEEQGIIRRDVYPETPVRVEYSLTEKGTALRDIIDSISLWGAKWM